MKRYLNPMVRTNNQGNTVILGNEENGLWLRLSKECYEYMIDGLRNGIDTDTLMAEFGDNEDRVYIRRLLEILEQSRMILKEGEHPRQGINQVTISITNRCNLKCVHCCIEADHMYEDYYSNKELFSVVDKVISCNPDSIVISGGEPLVRNDFVELSHFLRQRYKGETYLMTNATLITERMAEVISKCYDNVSVSIDGYDEKSCDYIRGNGVFNHIIRGIKLLKQYDCLNVETSMAVLSENPDTKSRFEALNEALGTKGVVRLMAPMGRAEKNRDLFASEKAGFLRKGTYVSAEPREKQNSRVIGRFHTCKGIIGKFCVGADGNLYPCAGGQLPEFSFGKILEISNLSEYIKNRKYEGTAGYRNFEMIQPSNQELCGKCENNIVCSECPLYMYLYHKTGRISKDECKMKSLYSKGALF